MRLTTLCYIEKDGRYLMLHRVKKANDVNRDKWVGVGGGFEAGESPEDCLLREVREETGLILTEYRFCGIITFVSDRFETEYMHLYHATGFSGTLIDCDEGVPEWIDRDHLFSLPMWEGDRLFLERMEQHIPFFSMKLVYEGDCLTEAVLDGRPMPLPEKK